MRNVIAVLDGPGASESQKRSPIKVKRSLDPRQLLNRGALDV